MLGELTLLHDFQIALVFIGRRLDLFHAFLAIAFKKKDVWISGQPRFLSAKLFIGTLKILQLDFGKAAEVVGLRFLGIGRLTHLGVLACDRVFFLGQVADRHHA